MALICKIHGPVPLRPLQPFVSLHKQHITCPACQYGAPVAERKPS